MAIDDAPPASGRDNERPVPRPRVPLIIGGIAIGGIVWMFLTIMLLIAWKAFGS